MARRGVTGTGHRRPRPHRFLWFALLLFSAQGEAAEARVAAASSLQFALRDIVDAYRNTYPQARVSITYGASGQLARQLERGAPFEVFLSADETYALRLRQLGLTRGPGRVYVLGRLHLACVGQRSPPPDPGLRVLGAGLPDGRILRLAIANPRHAPYGRAARQVLESLGWWEAFQPRLLVAENAAQATRMVQSGNADCGLLPGSLLKPAGLSQAAAVDPGRYRPLRHRLVLLRAAGPEARRFSDYLVSPRAMGLWQARGFSPPPPPDPAP